MKRLLVFMVVFAGLAFAGTPVEIRFAANGPEPSRLHVPTDQPYTLILVNQTNGPIQLFFDQDAELSLPERAFALRFMDKGPLVVPARGRLELEYWPTRTGVLHLRVRAGAARFLLELILEPPEYYEGPSGCS